MDSFIRLRKLHGINTKNLIHDQALAGEFQLILQNADQ